jgi:glycosyltransferase involved in cell wall biosynthesis
MGVQGPDLGRTDERNLEARVSVVIPARNEEANIARVLRSLAGQQSIREILVVDDQSEDRTSGILAELSGEIPRLRTLHMQSLPEGWLGKTHAVAEGARAATGDWLLFTDADTDHLPGSLAELLGRAEEEHADLLSVSPGQETPTWWEKSVIPTVYVELSRLFQFEDVSDPKSSAAAANGQYVLVRREVYERSGGHEAVKSEILEDVELARRIKSQGGKLLFLPGARWVRTRMYRSFGEMWRGWSKNLYLLYAGNLRRMLEAVASLWLLDVVPVLGMVGACLWLALGRGGMRAEYMMLGCVVLGLWRWWTYRRALARLGFDRALGAYQVIGALLVGLLVLNSARAHLATGRVEWKGRHYATKGPK